jgi:hypothetical protein
MPKRPNFDINAFLDSALLYRMSDSDQSPGDFMRWTSGGESQDIEDRRDDSGGGEGGGGFGFGGIHIGIGGFLILLVLSLVFKRNFCLSQASAEASILPLKLPVSATPPAISASRRSCGSSLSFSMTRRKPGRTHLSTLVIGLPAVEKIFVGIALSMS